MTQTVGLDAGLYVLSYFFHARTVTDNDNGIDVFLTSAGSAPTAADRITFSHIDDPELGWIEQGIQISVASAGDYDLTFAAVGLENSLGGYVDDVSLSAVPEAASLVVWALLGAFGVAIGWWRQRRAS